MWMTCIIILALTTVETPQPSAQQPATSDPLQSLSARPPTNDEAPALGHPQSEEIGRLGNRRIIDCERSNRLNAQQGCGSIEECDVHPERFIGRPPAETGSSDAPVVEGSRLRLRQIAVTRCDEGWTQPLTAEHSGVIEIDELGAAGEL